MWCAVYMVCFKLLGGMFLLSIGKIYQKYKKGEVFSESVILIKVSVLVVMLGTEIVSDVRK